MRLLAPAIAIAILATSGAARAEEPARQCPTVLRGVALVIRPIAGGVALDFMTPRQHEVPALRGQLREAALVLEQHSKTFLRPAAATAEPRGVRIPPLDISVNDVAAGARVIIRTQRARDTPELLDLAHSLELFWERSDCNEDMRARRPAPTPYLSA
jgi:hypothetical protein